MLLAYIDGSYDKVEYWLTALVVPAEDALQLQNDLDAVVSGAARSYGVSPDAELHGSYIRAGKGGWAGMKEMIRARIKVYSDALPGYRRRDRPSGHPARQLLAFPAAGNAQPVQR